jgi:hypothetical protein
MCRSFSSPQFFSPMSEQRVREKLDAFVREGKFYEAEQMYHTLFARYTHFSHSFWFRYAGLS